MTTEMAELGKWVLNLSALTFLGLGAWIGKGLANDVKKLQANSVKFEVFMGTMTEHMTGRDKLQDERWGGLNARVQAVDSKLDTVHRDIQALVHSNLKQDRDDKRRTDK